MNTIQNMIDIHTKEMKERQKHPAIRIIKALLKYCFSIRKPLKIKRLYITAYERSMLLDYRDMNYVPNDVQLYFRGIPLEIRND